MRKLITIIFILFMHFEAAAQCKFAWAEWSNQGLTDTASGSVLINGFTINMEMTANFNFDFTPQIFGYTAFNGYPDLPANDTVPRTTWAAGAGGQTTVCFSQPVVNPVLLLASIGNLSTPVTLNLSVPYSVLFDGGGNTFVNSTTIDALEGFCIIEFPGTYSCITIFSTTPEFYTNLTWGLQNPLNADFNFTAACVNDSTVFSSAPSFINSPGSIIGYQWDFGDGTTSTLTNPSHLFGNAITYNVQLVITSNNFCTDTISKLVTIHSAYHINNPQAICSGQSYSFNSHSYSASGIYYDTLTSYSGCDSIIETQLIINPAVSTNNPQSICSGGSYSFNSHVYNLTGNYYDTLTSFSGCDSVVITQLTIAPVITSNNPISICTGDSYIFNSHVYTTAGTYYDTLSSASGCDSVVVSAITVNSLPIISFTHPPDLCIDAAPIALNFASPIGGIYSGTGVINNTFDPKSASLGLNHLNYSYRDPASNCINNAQENITVHPLPVVSLSISPKYAPLNNANITYVDLTPNIVSSLWDFGDSYVTQDSMGIHLYSDTGHYNITLQVTDIFGCRNNSSESVFIDYEFEFYVPNSFTPNGDGVNDSFIGTGIGIGEFNMVIYNRWGKEIFETNDINIPWRGINVPGDTYVYQINLFDVYGMVHEYVGRVSLLR